MKTSLLTITVGVLLAAVITGMSPVSNAHPQQKNYNAVISLSSQKEVIIQVPEMNEKSLPLVRQNIEAAGGMTFKGFCHQQNVLLYVMDTNIHDDYSFLNTAFMNVSLGYLIKEGSIAQVQEACGMPVSSTADQTQN